MIIFIVVIFFLLQSTLNCADNDMSNARYKEAFIQVWKTPKLTNWQKYRLSLKIGLAQNQHVKQKLIVDEQNERENSIYRNYLASQVRGTSVLMDFFTMRF